MSPFSLFLMFAKFGCICFGGGYVLIPLLISELVEHQGILTMTTFGNLVSIAQVTPGPVGLNCATYAGYLQGGIAGSVSASFGLIAPTLLLGGLASWSIGRWKEHVIVQGLLKGVRPAALGMICYAVLIFLRMSVFLKEIRWTELFHFQFGSVWESFSPGGALICILTILALQKTKLTTTVLILLSALTGILLYYAGIMKV